MASLTVRYGTSHENSSSAYGYGLTVEVVNSEGMSGKIFVIYRANRSATDPELQSAETVDEFNHVATPADLHDIPDDVPDFDRTGSAYRTGYWEFSFRNPTDLAESLRLLKNDIKALVKGVNAEAEIEEWQEETYNG